MPNKLKKENIYTHIFFIALFLIVPSIAFVRPRGEPFMALTRVYVQDTAANFVLLCFFYINYYIFLPKLFMLRKYWLYGLCVILFLSIAFMLPYFTGRFFPENMLGKPPHLGQREMSEILPPDFAANQHSLGSFVFDEFRRHLSLFFTAIFFSFLLRARADLAKVKEEKLNAELSSLKAQINPHFLFNTLNSIYSLSVKKDDKVSDAIINLSGLMRYVIKEAQEHKILLQKELDYINNYIALQKARLGDTAVINFACLGQAGNKQIVPLLLISFIENAFKYGVNPDAEGSVIKINIEVTDRGLLMYVFNKKVSMMDKISSTGIGIANTTERLKKLYPGKHTILIDETLNDYSITLSLVLV